jgi:hypothetical protein
MVANTIPAQVGPAMIVPIGQANEAAQAIPPIIADALDPATTFPIVFDVIFFILLIVFNF